jgi:hypothetical protein
MTIMKNLILILCITLFVNKEPSTINNNPKKTVVQTSIDGSWEKSMNEKILTLTFKAKDKMIVTYAGDSILGTFIISKDDISISDNRCSSNPGKYKFSIKEDKLTFTLVSDECGGRNSFLPNDEWNRKKQ